MNAACGLLDLVDAAILTLDGQGGVIAANEGARSLLGRDAVGGSLTDALGCSPDLDWAARLVDRATVHDEIDGMTAKGAARLALTARPLPAAAAPGIWIVTLRPLPAVVDAGEMAHRLKNLLATVQALAASGRSAPSLRLFLASYLERLQVLARVYELLARQAWRHVGLVDLVQAVLSPQLAAGGRSSLALLDCRLPPNLAQTLGVVLQELSFNAQRFGALSTPAGYVRLVSEPANAGELCLLWEEEGGPPVALPSHRGFGVRMLGRMLDQHGGRCELDWRPEGLACRIVVPAGTNAGLTPSPGR